MENQFVPSELAVKLKELGFNERCFAYYNEECNNKINYFTPIYIWNFNSAFNNNEFMICAPLWQQSFDWFRVNHCLDGYIRCTRDIGACFRISHINDKTNGRTFSCFKDTYEEARYDCLYKLIELCK